MRGNNQARLQLGQIRADAGDQRFKYWPVEVEAIEHSIYLRSTGQYLGVPACVDDARVAATIDNNQSTVAHIYDQSLFVKHHGV